MIVCKKCQESNLPDQSICKKCGADLLPGETIGDRIINLVIGIAGGVIAALIATFLSSHPDIAESSEICLLTNPAAWYFAALAVPITAFVSAIRKTPLYTRYENRAIRHKTIDPDQALADYTSALENAPQKERAKLLKARAALYTQLGKEDQAVEDRLAYTYSEGAYEDESSFVRMFGADKDAFVSSSVKDERKRMLAEGKIKAVGFCKVCGKALELTEKLKCPDHPKAKPQDITYVVPRDVIKTIEEIEHKVNEERQKSGKKRVILFIILGLLLLLCIVIPALSAILSK